MNDTRTPISSYRVYIPVSQRLQSDGGRETDLYLYSDVQDVLTPLSAEKIMGSLYSAETSSIRYIAVIKKRAKGYQVQYSMKKKFPARKTKKKNAAKRTVTISRLKKKRTYYFRVRAYKKKANGSKVYGKWSKVKKVKIRK